MSARPKLGYIGIGLMGRPMTLRLLAAGYEVAVWNRSRNKLAPVIEQGAAGVDAKMLPEALEGGFADSLPLQIFGARMAARSFEPPLGTSAIMLKDLENAAAVTRETGVPLPMARTAAELYRLLGAQGGSECDPAMLVELLAGTR